MQYLQLSRPCIALLTIMMVWPVSVSRAVSWSDNFDDANVSDGTPVTWIETLPGTYDAASGDYIMSNPGDSDNDILLPVVNVPLATTYVRTQAAVLPGSLPDERGGTMGVVARWAPETLSGYAAILSNAGHLELLRLDGGEITTLNEIRNLPVDTSRDALIELDVVGDALSVFLWRPGEVKPVDPTVEAVDDGYPAGVAGIVYNENDDNTLGRFRFAAAQDTPFVEFAPGDLNGDGTVDAADAAIMFAGWGTGVLPSDINADDIVDAGDAGLMFQHWTGDTAPTVPEPSSGFIVAACAAGWWLRRNVRRNRSL